MKDQVALWYSWAIPKLEGIGIHILNIGRHKNGSAFRNCGHSYMQAKYGSLPISVSVWWNMGTMYFSVLSDTCTGSVLDGHISCDGSVSMGEFEFAYLLTDDEAKRGPTL